MRKALLILVSITILASCGRAGTSAPVLRNAIDSVSYCVGMDLGDYIVRTNQKMDIGDELDLDILMKGIQASMAEDNTINSDTRYEILRHFFNETLPEMNARSSEDFLQRAQKAKKNAVVSPSGLIYEIINPGNDRKPDQSSTVWFKYEGRRMDGSLYETTYDTDDIVSKPVEVMIPGIREGLSHIGEGGIIKLWISPSLAYGKDGNDYIGPNQALYYYIELVETR